ncbi:MAG: hypothetical protein JKY09_08850 [Crocinitomicaceae bacterium]|nr:hypothetical protein [Crocinitomicaceae bacterium]
MSAKIGVAQLDSTSPHVYPVSELKDDFNYWRKRLEKKHPLLYLYNSKAFMDAYLDSIYAAIDHPMTEFEFYRHIVPVVSTVKDGHNFIFPSKESVKFVTDHEHLLPLKLHVLQDELFVRYNLSANDSLPNGSTITHINNIPTDQILSKIITGLPRDGHNLQLPYAEMNVSFIYFYHLFYGFSKVYTIDFINERGGNQRCYVTGENLGIIKKIRKERCPEHPSYSSQNNGLNLKVIDSLETAILTIQTFDNKTLKKACKQNFRKSISTYFKIIEDASIANLVIDLRNNNGGNPDYVKFVLRYVLDEPFKQAIESRNVKSSTESNFFKRTKRKWYPKTGTGTFRPKSGNYAGDIFVLINEGSFSAAVEMSSVLDKYDRAVFIGSETGGNPIIMSGFFIKTSWKLPNTKIQISPGTLCSIYGDYSSNEGNGLYPDYPVYLTKQDILSNFDKSLDFTFQLIANKKNETLYSTQ